MDPERMPRWKRVVKGLLLAFVGASVMAFVVQEARRGPAGVGVLEDLDAGVRHVVACFHRATRCVSCRAIEGAARRAVEAECAPALREGRVVLRLVDLDMPENAPYGGTYGVTGPAVVLLEREAGAAGRWKRLDGVWDHIGDTERLEAHIREELKAFVSGKQD